MTELAPISITAVVAPSERPGLVAASEQLAECLSHADGAPWPVRLQFGAPGQAPPLPEPGTAGVVVMSLLPAVGRVAEPIGETHARWRALLQPAVDAGVPLFVCTVFRAVPNRASSPGAPSPILERIRRLNLMATGLSRELGVTIVDIDRALTHIGARTLGTDYRLGGRLAAEVAGHQVVRGVLSFGLDDVVAPELQEAALAFHGDLHQIDAFVQRRLSASRTAASHG